MELLVEIVFDGAEFIFELAMRLIEAMVELLGWSFDRSREWLDRQPDRDWSEISILYKLGRLSLAVGLSLVILVPLLMLVWN